MSKITKDETTRMIAVMQAFVSGRPLEVLCEGETRWRSLLHPAWDWRHNDYRVGKPQPQQVTLSPMIGSSGLVEYTKQGGDKVILTGKDFIELTPDVERTLREGGVL
jgi:hypothetical protein